MQKITRPYLEVVPRPSQTILKRMCIFNLTAELVDCIFSWVCKKSNMASQTGLKEVVSLYQTLIKEWNRKPVDLEKVGKLLSGMKVSCNVSFSSNTLLLNCFSDLRMISLALAFNIIIHYDGSFTNLCSTLIWNAVMVLSCLNIVILFLHYSVSLLSSNFFYGIILNTQCCGLFCFSY